MNVLALFLAIATLAAQPATRIVHFRGGRAKIQQQRNGQAITITGSNGSESSFSFCDAQSGGYDQIVAFATSVKHAAQRDDRAMLGRLMQYPLRINVGANRGYTVASRRMLMLRFNRVFTANIRAQLAQFEPHDVFCRDGMSMLAGGVVWATTDAHHILRGAIINAF